MARRSRQELKEWFRRGCYPTEAQFGDLIDSFLHPEEERLSIGDIEGLAGAVNSKLDSAEGEVLRREHNEIVDAQKRLNMRVNSVTPKLLRIEDLDTMGYEDLGAFHVGMFDEDDGYTRYAVMGVLGGKMITVGLLDVLKDSGGHVVTQMLTTKYDFEDGKLMTGSHHDWVVRRYVRHFNVASSSDVVNLGEWSPWEDVEAGVVDRAVEEVGVYDFGLLSFDANQIGERDALVSDVFGDDWERVYRLMLAIDAGKRILGRIEILGGQKGAKTVFEVSGVEREVGLLLTGAESGDVTYSLHCVWHEVTAMKVCVGFANVMLKRNTKGSGLGRELVSPVVVRRLEMPVEDDARVDLAGLATKEDVILGDMAELIRQAELVGAVWNKTRGLFSLNGLDDLTPEDMANTLMFGKATWMKPAEGGYMGLKGNKNPIRTNWVQSDPDATAYFCDLRGSFRVATSLEVLNIGRSDVYSVRPQSLEFFCYGCRNLRKVLGWIVMRNCTVTKNAFVNCVNLETLFLAELRTDFDASTLESLSLESLRFWVDHAKNTAPITITVHESVYAKLDGQGGEEWETLLLEAMEKDISFATKP